MKLWRNLLIILLLSVVAFGGTFTCRAHSGESDSTMIVNPRPVGSPSK